MATRTDNLGLIKPSYDDTIDVQNLNDNMDLIDEQFQRYLPLSGGTVLGELSVLDKLNFNGGVINGNIDLVGGYSMKMTTENGIRFEGYNNNAYIEINNNGSIYTSSDIQTNSDEIRIKSNGGTNLAVNDNGYAYLNGSSMWSDKYYNGESGLSNNCTLEWQYYRVSQATILMMLTIVNPNSYRGNLDITYPIPFKDTSYHVVNGCENNNNDTDVRINGDFRHCVSRRTTTGCQLATDNLTNSVLFILGRV